MLLAATEPPRDPASEPASAGGPEGPAAPEPGAEGARAEPEQRPPDPPEAASDERRFSVEDLPTYPRSPGRAAREAAARRRQHRMILEEESGLPTYPREPGKGRRHKVLDRVLVLALTLAAVLLIAYAVTRVEQPGAPQNALEAAAVAAAGVEISLETNSPSRVRQFVRDEFGWSMGVPVFRAAELLGVGIGSLAPTIEVPVFVYRDHRGRQAVLFVLNYALLDHVADRVHLSRAEYERLAEDPAPRAQRLRGREVLLWRDRAEIYILVTDIPAEMMAHNIRVDR